MAPVLITVVEVTLETFNIIEHYAKCYMVRVLQKYAAFVNMIFCVECTITFSLNAKHLITVPFNIVNRWHI